MKEYIDMTKRTTYIGGVFEALLGLGWAIQETVEFCNKLPAADVVERKRGEWEHLDNDWFDLWRCTACGDEWTFEYDPTSTDTRVNFCPNCGADMRSHHDSLCDQTDAELTR